MRRTKKLEPLEEPESLEGLEDVVKPEPTGIAILECLTAPAWHALYRLTTEHVHGRLSYEAWTCATSAILREGREIAALQD